MAIDEAEGEAIFSFADSVKRIISDYFELGQWFKVNIKSKILKKEKTYNGRNPFQLWRDILGPYYALKKTSKCKIF